MSRNPSTEPGNPENAAEVEWLKEELRNRQLKSIELARKVTSLKNQKEKLKAAVNRTTDAEAVIELQAKLEKIEHQYTTVLNEAFAILKVIKALKQRIHDLELNSGKRNKPNNNNQQLPFKSDDRNSDKKTTSNSRADGTIPKASADSLDRSPFGEATMNSVLQPKASKLDRADNSSKLSELTPFESVFEQLQPEEKSLDEILYPKMTAQCDAEGFMRRRKDGQPKSMAENLFPSNFPDDDYDLVEIDPVGPVDPLDNNPFAPAGMRRKRKKKRF